MTGQKGADDLGAMSRATLLAELRKEREYRSAVLESMRKMAGSFEVLVAFVKRHTRPPWYRRLVPGLVQWLRRKAKGGPS